ncbi:MAG: Lrp/AsnC ligand binding domain-containing protein [Gammaproteobacteria bacterium]|nr:Lrp/AsnC ligand binding domain-containing protein [Gammaproteobacteria bacterium]
MEIYKTFDQIDKKILNELQLDGRLAFSELASRVCLSKTPCLNRVRRLEQCGIIRHYRADLDPDLIQQGYLVFVQVTLTNTKRASLEAFNNTVVALPEVISCHMMAGGYDYLLKVRTSDMRAYRQFIGSKLSMLPGVDKTTSFPVMEQVKESNIYQL